MPSASNEFRNEHFERFPCLRPLVGSQYASGSHKKSLLVAESHYLPKQSKLHLDAKAWYSSLSEQDLGVTLDNRQRPQHEKAWRSTAGIMSNAGNRKNNFAKRGHTIHRRISNALGEVGLTEQLPGHVCDHYAYYNFFQRSAQTQGGSLKLSDLDKQKAEEILHVVLETLRPDLVIFISSKAGSLGYRVCREREVYSATVPHPACAWWNRYAAKSRGTGKEKFKRILTQQQWLSGQSEYL